MPRPGRVLWDRLAALLLLAFAVYIVAVARQLTYMQGRVPRPGFAPFWIGVGPGGRQEEEPPPPARSLTLVAIGAVTIAAIALIERVGMLTALALVLLALGRILGGSWRAAVLTAIGLPLFF